MSLTLIAIAEHSAHLAPLAGRGQQGKDENQNSARVRGPLHDSERLRLAEAPPHPDLLPARGEKETAVRVGGACASAIDSPEASALLPRDAAGAVGGGAACGVVAILQSRHH